MAKKDFKLLLAFENRKFQTRIIQKLRAVYTVSGVKSLKDLTEKLRRIEPSLVIVDQRFGNREAGELQEQIIRFCPHIVFVVYSHAERRSVAKRLRKYRAIDYIIYNSRILDFTEKVHKAVRWTILQNEVKLLSTKVNRIAESIKVISKRIEKAY